MEAVLAAARSGAPSPLKSLTATPHDMLPTASGAPATSVAVASSTETVLDPQGAVLSFATATSSLPSLLKSPGPPRWDRGRRRNRQNPNVPLPLPSKLKRCPRYCWPGPVLRSVTVEVAHGNDQTLSVLPGRKSGGRNVPSPRPSSTASRRSGVGDDQIGPAVAGESPIVTKRRTAVHRDVSRR